MKSMLEKDDKEIYSTHNETMPYHGTIKMKLVHV